MSGKSKRGQWSSKPSAQHHSVDFDSNPLETSISGIAPSEPQTHTDKGKSSWSSVYWNFFSANANFNQYLGFLPWNIPDKIDDRFFKS